MQSSPTMHSPLGDMAAAMPSPSLSPLRSAPNGGQFVEWEEQFVSLDRGNRVVHYFLKDRLGRASLAVIGTERSLRHMVYVVCDEFLPLAGLEKSATPAFKWRARREVVDWLASLLTKPAGDMHTSGHSLSEVNVNFETNGSMAKGKEIVHGSKKSQDVAWIGASWTCRKRLCHYNSFQRNGITISVHDFVYVMSEEEEHHIAYVEDMYEDKKCRKKLRVRWFHKTSELACKIPPPLPRYREVFYTQFPQVLSVECVDGLATVLTPEHFDKCAGVLPADAMAQVHLCSREFDHEGIKSFDICQVDGYWHQRVLRYIDVAPHELSPTRDMGSDDMEVEEEDDAEHENTVRRGPRSTRCSRKRSGTEKAIRRSIVDHHSVRMIPEHSSGSDLDFGNGGRNADWKLERSSFAFDIGDKIEYLCQDSGVRGCWFQGTVIKKVAHRLKIRYEELQDEDGNGKLEEWVSSFKLAGPDKLGMRASGRSTVRPSPLQIKQPSECETGAVIDAWWNDGWWEGIIVGQNSVGDTQVYFPGECDIADFHCKDLRISRDWVNGQWLDVRSNAGVINSLGIVNKDSVQRACHKQCAASENHSNIDECQRVRGTSVKPEEVSALISNISGKDQRSEELGDHIRSCPDQEEAKCGPSLVSSKMGSTYTRNRYKKESSQISNGQSSFGSSQDDASCDRGEMSILGEDSDSAGPNERDFKKARHGHENLKPIHVSGSIFVGSLPMASLVMSR